MGRSRQSGGVARHRGWWVVRFREQVGVGGVVQTRLRAKRLARVDADHKTKASVRHLAAAALEPVNRGCVDPLTVTTLQDFVDRVYLPYAEQQKGQARIAVTARSGENISKTLARMRG